MKGATNECKTLRYARRLRASENVTRYAPQALKYDPAEGVNLHRALNALTSYTGLGATAANANFSTKRHEWPAASNTRRLTRTRVSS